MYNKDSSLIPAECTPISAWGYLGDQLLFALPIAGFILLIIFSCGGTSNINLRNSARSYWCSLIVIMIIFAVVFAVVTGLASSLN